MIPLKNGSSADHEKGRVIMRELPRAQEIYRHFKGNLYQIVSLAIHSETEEQMVVYQALYGNYAVYVRPLELFMSMVDRDKYPKTEQIYRFEKVEISCASDRDIAQDEVREKAAFTIPGEIKTEQSDSVSGQEEWEQPKEEASSGIHPQVLAFLDADTYEEKLRILSSLQDQLDDQMINTMAVCEDLEIKPGTIEERYDELRTCLLTLERFECNRLR